MDPVERFLDWLRAERGASPHTIRAYGSELRRLAECVAPRTLLEAGVADLRSHLARGASAPSSLQRRIASLRTFFRWAQRERLLATNPAERLSSPKVRRPLPRVPHVAETSAMIEGTGALRDAAILEVMYGSGLRVSEVAALDREDVDLHAGLLTVRSGKGRKGRVVPVGGPEAAALTAWLGERGGHAGALFLNRSGQRLSVRGLYDIVRKAGIAAGIGGLHPHALRHAFATHLLGGGADIRSIQDMLGHASLATTQRYAAVDVQLLMDTWRKAHPHAGRPEPG